MGRRWFRLLPDSTELNTRDCRERFPGVALRGIVRAEAQPQRIDQW